MSAAYIIIILILLLVVLYFLFGRGNNSANEDDAKRFAKFLISEIRLYENYKFERGLKNNNLHESLKDEIERARRMYKKRVPNAEFERHFDDALIEVLADGDKSKLGA